MNEKKAIIYFLKDRLIIIDKKTLYHSGSSFKDIGKKCFGINIINDDNIIENILKEMSKL